jgi:hypothetical protein
MNRKEFIEWLEGLLSAEVKRLELRKQDGDSDSANYQLGKVVAYRIAIAKLKEQDESEEAE